MKDADPTPEQIAVLDYVCTMQRQFQTMLRDVGLTYAADKIAQFDDPAFHDNEAA